MNEVSSSLFDFSGFAAKNDIEKYGWQALFNALEKEQTEFLKNEKFFRSDTYKWPRDPLHTWSRVWEYPYVYHHIRRAQEKSQKKELKILDFGSGVTFFPFAVAKLGCDIICADIDPVCSPDIQRAGKHVQHAPGNVNVAIIENGRIPVESASQDIIYCISVVEHIPNFESAIDEMLRVLKPSGQLILTVDIDLRGNSDLGSNEFERLQTALGAHFVKQFPERPVHPCNLLTTADGPYHLGSKSLAVPIKQLIKSALRGVWVNGSPRVGLFLGVYGAIFTKNG